MLLLRRECNSLSTDLLPVIVLYGDGAYAPYCRAPTTLTCRVLCKCNLCTVPYRCSSALCI